MKRVQSTEKNAPGGSDLRDKNGRTSRRRRERCMRQVVFRVQLFPCRLPILTLTLTKRSSSVQSLGLQRISMFSASATIPVSVSSLHSGMIQIWWTTQASTAIPDLVLTCYKYCSVQYSGSCSLLGPQLNLARCLLRLFQRRCKILSHWTYLPPMVL